MKFHNKLRIFCYFTPWRIKWYPRAFLFAIAVAFVIIVFFGKGSSTLTGRVGGDYPAFYGAGRIIAEGNWQGLYDVKRQISSQKDLYPQGNEGFLPYVYPPYVAMMYYPFSLISYRLSYAIHTLLMLGILLVTVWCFHPVYGNGRDRFILVFCLSLSFYPIFRAVFGGQNTVITILLIFLSWRAVLAKNDFLAGIILGLLLFKPQFALPLIGLYLISGHWRAGIGIILAAAVLYATGALISGPCWPVDWIQFSTWSAKLDAGINHANAICWIGFLQAILGQKSQLAIITGWGFVFAASFGLVLMWIVGIRRHGDFTSQLGITTAALILIPPHVMYYDAGLLIFTCVAMVATSKESSWILLCLIWVLGFSQLLGDLIGFSPLFFVSLLTLAASTCILGPWATGFRQIMTKI